MRINPRACVRVPENVRLLLSIRYEGRSRNSGDHVTMTSTFYRLYADHIDMSNVGYANIPAFEGRKTESAVAD